MATGASGKKKKNSKANQVLTEEEVSSFSTAIGNNWMGFVLALGISRRDMDDIFRSSGSSADETLKRMLLLWKSNSGDKATFDNLKQAMSRAHTQQGTEISWERVEKLRSYLQ